MKALAGRLLVVLLVWVAAACSTQTDPRDRFVGEWKSVSVPSPTHTIIRRNDDNYFITEGKQDLIGVYDPETKGILIDNGTRKVPVLYIPETDEIIVSAGEKSAKFARVK